MIRFFAISKNETLIELSVLKYENLIGESWNEKNWLSCLARLRFGGWQSEFQFSCFTSDIEGLKKSLTNAKDDIKNAIEFIPLEPDLQFRIDPETDGKCAFQLLSSWRSNRNGKMRSDLVLECVLTADEISSLAAQVSKCSITFVEKKVEK
jgi:hypothetical protein